MTKLIWKQTNIAAKTKQTLAVLAIAGVGVLGATSAGQAESGGLEGSWKGGGWVSIAGNRERAHCHVHYTPAGSQYSLNATCATDSGKVSQTARVHKAGDHAYKGSFYNSEYDVSGQVRIIVRGNTQTVTLTSEGGTALLTLTR